MRREGRGVPDRARWRAVLAAIAVSVLVCPVIGWPTAAGADPAATYADGPVGAARGVTGGAGGPVVAVTSLAEKGPGTLRELARPPGPRVIIFAVSGQITSKDPILVGSNVTIDGRGADVQLTGDGLRLDAVENVIIRNLRFSKGGGESSDAIAVMGGSKRIWIDHNELESFGDGLIDVTQESTAVTISWNVLRDHGKAMLLGAGKPEGSPPLVDLTIHNNLLQRTGERNPLMRHGRFHIWNNVIEQFGYSHESGYNIRTGCGAIALYDSNVVIPASNPRAFTFEDEECDAGREPALAVAASDLGGLTVTQQHPELVPGRAQFDPASVVQAADATLISTVHEGAGWHRLPAAYTVTTTPARNGDGPDGDGGGGAGSTRTFALAALFVGLALVVGGFGWRAERSRRSRSH